MTSSMVVSTPDSTAGPAPLDAVVLRDAIARRPVRAPNIDAENAAYIALAKQLTEGSQAVLQSLVDAAVSLCDAGTAGVSLLEAQPAGPAIFRWTALSGALAAHIGGTTPRNFSPCGYCLDQGRPVHFSHPERRFEYFKKAGIPFVEALVLPFDVDGKPDGTIWIIAHDTSRKFDLEDVRIMTRIATFTGAAYSMLRKQTIIS